MTGVRKCALIGLVLAAAIPATARGVPTCAADSEPGLRLVLNIPAARLDVLEGEALARSYRVAIGTPDHPTPIGSYRVDRVIWNPWWVPPPFEWARKMKLTPPGPDNPTGRVKLFFGYYLFLHGTPLEESLGRPGSHGCVRLAR